MGTMEGAILPGNSTVELRDFEIPKPGFGQVLIKLWHLLSAAAISAVFTGNMWEKDRRLISQEPLQVMNPAGRS